MEGILTYIIFFTVLCITIKTTAASLAILLNINLFRAIPYVNYKAPFYGYYNKNDIVLGALLPVLCFIIIVLKVIWKKKKIKYKLDVLDVFMLLLSFVMVISIFISPYKNSSIYYTGIFLILGCPFYFITKLFFLNTKNFRKDFLIFISFILFFALLFSVLSIYLHSVAKYPYERMTFPGVYPIPFCLFLCSALIILIVYYIKPGLKNELTKRSKLLFSIPVLAIVVLAIIKSNTRGPVFAMLLSFAIVLSIFFKIKLNAKIIISFMFAIFTGLVVFVTAFDVRKIAVRFINLVPKDADSLGPRILAYIDSVKLLINRPWGISVGTFGQFYSDKTAADDPSSRYAHNLFMELISSFGVVGILLSFLIIYLCLYEYNFIIKNQKQIFTDHLFFLVIILVVFFFCETQFSFTLNTHKGWYLSLALYAVFKFKFLKNKYNEK